MPKSLTSIKDLIKDTPGWLSDGEAHSLYKTANQCQGKGVIVEIGSWKGKSTICLGTGSKQGKGIKIYAIDPHIDYQEAGPEVDGASTLEEFQANIARAGVDNLITPLVMPSYEAVEHIADPIEFLFIDGSHTYEAVKKDFDTWVPKIIDGGTVALHDTVGMAGPRRVVNEKLFFSKHFRNIRIIDEITMAQKVQSVSFIDRCCNLGMYGVKQLANLSVMIKLPKPIRTLGKKLIGRY